jgi:ABC-type nitrate/sulfonate/bicarbonate transport system permease component
MEATVTLRRVLVAVAVLFGLGVVVGFAIGLLQPRRAEQVD